MSYRVISLGWDMEWLPSMEQFIVMRMQILRKGVRTLTGRLKWWSRDAGV